MGLGEDLLEVISSYSGGYRLARRRMRGDYRENMPKRLQRASDATLWVTLSRLKKKGLVENRKGAWRATKEGILYLTNKMRYRKLIPSGAEQRRTTVKDMIIAFDIPERYKRERNWLREQLRHLGFAMLQKSVWFGPAPLPKEFILVIKELKILDFIKFFKAEERDIV